jgi:hypothetical protein
LFLQLWLELPRSQKIPVKNRGRYEPGEVRGGQAGKTCLDFRQKLVARRIGDAGADPDVNVQVTGLVRLASKDAEVAKKTEALRKEQEELVTVRAKLEVQVNTRLQAERGQISATEAKKAREAAAAELQAKAQEVEELRATLVANDIKLAEAQQAQAEVLRRERALDEQKRELELTIEQRVNASVDDIRSKARQEADEAAR